MMMKMSSCHRNQLGGRSEKLLTIVCTLLSSALLTGAFKLDLDRSARSPYKSNSHHSRSAGEAEHNALYFKDHTPSGVVRVQEGKPFTFECRASGSRPTIHFLLDGQRIIQGVSHDVLDDEASYEELAGQQHGRTMNLSNTKARLVLDCVSARDAGQYTCVAETPYQRITTNTYLQVEPSSDSTEETCVLKRTQSGSPARIHMWTDLRVQYEGNSVQLYCRAGGNPTPTITWYARKNLITDDDPQYTLLTNGDLLIRNIAFMKNMGDYHCVAENGVGRDVAETFLYPLGTTEEP